MSFVDLFCGSGGLSQGLIGAGHRVVRALDNWRPAVDVYNRNIPYYAGIGYDARPAALADLSDPDAVVRLLAPKMDGENLIVGGPPCQEFSSAAVRRKVGMADLTPAFARAVAGLRPAAFAMENVPNARNSAAFAEAVSVFRGAGYGLTGACVDAAHCGLPQRRERLVCIGVLGGADGELLADLRAGLLPERSLAEHFAQSGIPLPYELYYRHPVHYGRKAVYSVDEVSPTVRGINRPKPKEYHRRIERMASAGEPLPKNCGAPPWEDVHAMSHDHMSAVQGFPSDWDWSPARFRSATDKAIGNAVPPAMGRVIGGALRAWRARTGCRLR